MEETKIPHKKVREAVAAQREKTAQAKTGGTQQGMVAVAAGGLMAELAAPVRLQQHQPAQVEETEHPVRAVERLDP